MFAQFDLSQAFLAFAFFGPGLGIWRPYAYAATEGPGAQVYGEAAAKRVAIIGGGAAGSSTAYHLRQFADDAGLNINITIYEKRGRIGGRTTTVNAYGDPLQPVELGASIFVKVNEILMNATHKFGLKPKDSETEVAELLGVWNGEKFVFTQEDSDWQWWDNAKMIWKYGLAPIRTIRLMRKTVGQFLKLYKAPFFPFRSLSDRAEHLGLLEATSVTGEQYLATNNIAGAFATDIIQASTRVNYGQNLGLIHGLETMVCMAIEGAMQIEGGNWQIFDNMVKASNATLHLNTTVTNITKKDGKYSVAVSSKDEAGEAYSTEEGFDTVVLAGPLQFSGLELDKAMASHIPDEIPYVSLHVTLFASPKTLDPVYFNLAPGERCPNSILTTLPPSENPGSNPDGVGKAGFFSISTLRTTINPKTQQTEYLYKIFSPKKVTAKFLSDILGVPIPEDLSTISTDSGDAISWYFPTVFHSYPYEYPRVTFEELELAPGFYYTSGIESFISCMETSALMGMNVAQLIVDDYLGISKPDIIGDSKQQVIFEKNVVEEL
ncbi:Prenylcysteine lyase-domain-containing protein [Xylogone sp. PMI_703]|nr:Prenylcysteine lyase-domain-containing protein [Xylogone sp. PMI_703]